VSWPHWRSHSLRTALTVVGIALGATVVVAVADVSESVLASFRHMVSAVAGDSDLEITSATGSVDEGTIETAAGVAGVEAAAGLVESFLPLADQPERSVYLLGVDFLGSPVWESQLPRAAIEIEDEIAFVAQADSAVLTRKLAARDGLEMGGELRVTAPDGPRALRVRGLLDDAPPARLFDGNLVVMDLPGAQRLLAREGRVDRVAVTLAPGARADDVRDRLAAALGPAVDVAAPEARGEQAERLLFSLRTMLATLSALAVIVGAFIVHHTVAVSVHQRRREFAVLNAVGIGRRALIVLCLLETLVLATIGIALGLGAGQALARLAGGVIGATTSELWMPLEVDQHAHSAIGALVAVCAGLATALVSAYLAVRATFRPATVEALRPVGVELETSQGAVRIVRTLVLVAVLVAMPWIGLLFPPDLGFVAVVGLIVATYSAAYLGGAVLAPLLVRTAGESARRLTLRSSLLPLRLAAENLPRNPGRGGATVATVTVAAAMAVVVGTLVQSFQTATLGWIEQHFGGDLFVGSGARVRVLAGPPMSEDVGRALARVPGVESVEPFRVMSIRLDGRPVFLQGISLPDRLAHGGMTMVEGNFAAAADALEAGTAVLVSDNLAFRLGVHPGDELTLPTPAGPRSFAVAGVFIDYIGSIDLGAVGVASTQLAAIWGDRQANLFRIWLDENASASAVREEMLARLGAGYYVITSRDFLDSVRAALRRFFLASWALQLIAALVGVIGVVNAQLATVLDRAPEIRLLRTVGLSLRDLARSVLLECGALGVLGGLSGFVLGATIGANFVLVMLPLVTGFRVPLVLALAPPLAGVLIAGAISALAGYVPARATARIEAAQQSID
jgi:putative ABC transport system permease protein